MIQELSQKLCIIESTHEHKKYCRLMNIAVGTDYYKNIMEVRNHYEKELNKLLIKYKEQFGKSYEETIIRFGNKI